MNTYKLTVIASDSQLVNVASTTQAYSQRDVLFSALHTLYTLRTEDFLSLRGRNSDGKNLCFMLIISYKPKM